MPKTPSKSKRQRSLIIEIAINLIVLSSLALLIYGLFGNPTAEQRQLMGQFDVVISLILLAEFFIRLFQSANRRRYFAKYWWLLLAAIPIPTPFIEALKIVRVADALRLVRLSEHVLFESRQ